MNAALDKYLEIYPDAMQDYMAAEYAWGEEKAAEVYSEALKLGKKVVLIDHEEALDLLTYRFE